MRLLNCLLAWLWRDTCPHHLYPWRGDRIDCERTRFHLGAHRCGTVSWDNPNHPKGASRYYLGHGRTST